MNSTKLTRRIDELKLELEVLEHAETEYASHPERPQSQFQKHNRRIKRFQEITRELLRLAEETAH